MVTGGTGYALAALLCYGLGDFIYKRAAAANIRPHHFLAAQAWCFFPAVLVYGVLTRTLVLTPAAGWGALAGVFIFIGFYSFLRSLATGSVSINAPIYRLNFVITAILAIIFLNEAATAAMLVALALAIIAIWLLLGSREHDRRSAIDRGSLIAVLIATAALGAANFLHAMGLRQGGLPETLITAQAAIFVTLSAIFVRITDGTIAVPVSAWRHAPIAAIVLIAAFLFMLHGVAEGPASVLVPMAQMGFVVTAALGILLLKEPITAPKRSGSSRRLPRSRCWRSRDQP